MPSIGLANASYRTVSFDVVLNPQINKGTKPAQGTAGLQIGPLVPDTTSFYDGITQGLSLRDLTEGQDWLCKRIVGKAHLFMQGNTTWSAGGTWSRGLITMGIFVARAEDDAPANPDLDDDEMDPGNLQNIRNPWMFRRTWVLDNPEANGTAPLQFGPAQNNNASWVGEAGPHIDVRVARRIRREERLWYSISYVGGDLGLTSVSQAIGLQPTLEGHIDLRFLGAMRRSNNRSTF